MSSSTLTIQRPQRWDSRFSDSMRDEDVAKLLDRQPFGSMNPKRFPPSISLHALLLNDTKITEYGDGEIIIREGDYGSSAFLILDGNVEVILKSLPDSVLGRGSPKKDSWFTALSKSLFHPSHPESRTPAGTRQGSSQPGTNPRIFLQDFPRVLSEHGSVTLGEGEFFGELAALSRTPRTATVVSRGNSRLLEIRWQGLRDLLRFDPALKDHVHKLYRENSLLVHLRETPILKGVSEEGLQEIAAATVFESHGDFDWFHDFRKIVQQDVERRIDSEPIIVEEGDYPNGLLLIRSGFARLSRRRDQGHQTFEYLGKGRMFGLEELAFNWKHSEQLPWQRSLRAVGYVDILRIPTSLVEKYILPTLDELPILVEPPAPSKSNSLPQDEQSLDTSLLEFLGDHRLMNGRQAMVIDLNRCIRCDDCVQACAATHNNNPRFVRHGPKHENLMFATACMHCEDPVCMIGCPTGAIGRQPETGVVFINDSTCIGCATCANSCPYSNIRMVEARDSKGRLLRGAEDGMPIVKATKCDLCMTLPAGPSCQRACPHDALVRIDLSDQVSLEAWLARSPKEAQK